MLKIFRICLYVLFLVIALFASGFINTIQGNSVTSQDDSSEEELISAIVVVRAASGKSYVADREYIAAMPEMKLQEEIKSFIEGYEPSIKDAENARLLLENSGLTITAHDNLFIMVSGTLDKFQAIIPKLSTYVVEDKKSETILLYSEDFKLPNGNENLINAMIILPSFDDKIMNTAIDGLSVDSKNNGINIFADEVITYEGIQNALKLDRVHNFGIRGSGVRVGFIDQGVFSGHEFFREHPANIKYLKHVQGKITFVGNNYDDSLDLKEGNHGTAVASFLVNSAPDAKFYSMSLSSGSELLSYLIFINNYHLIDVLNLSQGIWEETPGVDEGIAEFRLEFLNLIAQKGIILIAGGNYGQNIAGYTSGHNAIAAIPEVIAVGGSDLNGFIFSASQGASSFSSILYPGRNVPDVVSIFGPLQTPALPDGYKRNGGYGTSYSTPQLAGMAALLKGLYPEIMQSQMKTVFQQNSFDIQDGISGDGDRASIGYDFATGYGQPLANWVVKYFTVLYPGWNLIGITKDYPNTGANMLNEIQSQGGDCNTVCYWSVETQSYVCLVVIGGIPYGFDFDLSPKTAYWVKCNNNLYWNQSGTKSIDTFSSINLSHGFTGFSVPVSTHTCLASDLIRETNGTCWQVAEYDGRYHVYKDNGQSYGEDFELISGKGYMVTCDSNTVWTPDCSASKTNSQDQKIIRPDNVFSESSNFDLVAKNAIGEENLNNSTAFDSTNCTITNTKISNISGNTFSLSWITNDPCPGVLYINKGNENDSIAYDDRGLQYAGTTHHITVRGLSPRTTYNYTIISGNVNNASSVTTGAKLDQPSTNYVATGKVIGEDFNSSSNAIIYAWLEDEINNKSALISFGLDETMNGYSFVLGNSRIADNSAYFNLTTAKYLNLEFESGSAGNQSLRIQVTLANNPQVSVPGTILESVPDAPILLFPQGAIFEEYPTFKFSVNGDDSQELKYRIELSRDNFDSLEFVFDQRSNLSGWSAASYFANQEASFTIPTPLEEMVGYQWRVFAYDVKSFAWGEPSDIVGFAIIHNDLFLPLIIK